MARPKKITYHNKVDTSVLKDVDLDRLADLLYNRLSRDSSLTDKSRQKRKISLRDYIKEAWPVIDGSRYIHNWHIDCLSDHLEALFRRDIRKLIICIPPRMGKSQICSVCFPTWVWIHAPETQIYTASYSNELCVRDSWKSRVLIQSSFYQSRWGGLFRLRDDSNRKTRYDNDKNGYRLALSTLSSSTGHGYDLLIIDDPHKATDVKSTSKREQVISWYTDAISTRANNPDTAVQIVIGQRLHQMDLIGYLIATGEWEVLKLPMEYVPTNHVTSIGWKDPRTFEGELLFPARFDYNAVSQLKKDLGSALNISAQLQQEPVPPDGSYIKLSYFRRYINPPDRLDTLIASFDFAIGSTQTDTSYAVCVVMGRLASNYYVLDVFRTKGHFQQQMQLVEKVTEKYKKRITKYLIERQGLGFSIGEILKKDYNITNVDYYTSIAKDKVSRLELCLDIFENQRVLVPEDYVASWVTDYVLELTTFPRAANDDQVDATTQALLWYKNNSSVSKVLTTQQIDLYNQNDDFIVRNEHHNNVGTYIIWRPDANRVVYNNDGDSIAKTNKQIRTIFGDTL